MRGVHSVSPCATLCTTATRSASDWQRSRYPATPASAQAMTSASLSGTPSATTRTAGAMRTTASRMTALFTVAMFEQDDIGPEDVQLVERAVRVGRGTRRGHPFLAAEDSGQPLSIQASVIDDKQPDGSRHLLTPLFH